MFYTILKAEIKNMFRDKLYIFFMIYPVVLGVVGYYLVPYVEKEVPGPLGAIIAMMLIVLTGFIFGALTAFTLLDDKDDKVLMSLKVTPISVKLYVWVKMGISMVFGFIATLVLIFATGFLPDASILTVISISILGALQAPALTLIVNSFSDNKVEGFVIMKLSGLIIVFPVIGFLVSGGWQYVLGISPSYWGARLIEFELIPSEDGSAFLVFLFGVAYNILTMLLLMKLYSKRSNI